MKRHTSGFSPLLLLIKLNINIGLLIEAKKRISPPLDQVPKVLCSQRKSQVKLWMRQANQLLAPVC